MQRRIEIKIADFTSQENVAVDYLVGRVPSLTATELIDKEEKKRNKVGGSIIEIILTGNQ